MTRLLRILAQTVPSLALYAFLLVIAGIGASVVVETAAGVATGLASAV